MLHKQALELQDYASDHSLAFENSIMPKHLIEEWQSGDRLGAVSPTENYTFDS